MKNQHKGNCSNKINIKKWKISNKFKSGVFIDKNVAYNLMTPAHPYNEICLPKTDNL